MSSSLPPLTSAAEENAASLRKSARTRKRPLPPDATYNESVSTPRSKRSGTEMTPFSPALERSTVAGTEKEIQTNGTSIDDDAEPEEDPVWTDFSADYYEVVEQLPLELHRNFALLTELDEQTQRQTSRLLEIIRQYVNSRIAHRPPSSTGQIEANIESASSHNDHDLKKTLGSPLPSLDTLKTDFGMNGDHLDASMDVDAEAGPSRHQDAIPEALTHTTTSSGEILYSVKLTPNLLPEIGRLAKEVIRGADEKIGIASGCYNSVDRHIRSMDAALQTQQAAVNMGIQTGTLPSEMITGSTGLGASGAQGMDDGDADPTRRGRKMGHEANAQEAMGVFSGGRGPGSGVAGGGLAVDGLNIGLTNGASIAGKASKGDTGPIPIVLGYVAAQNFELAVDPNEPRYCYCQNVSHGEMIGCENEDCPHGGWFHLTCVGMLSVPKDEWWCNDCRPSKQQGKVAQKGKPGRGRKKQKR